MQSHLFSFPCHVAVASAALRKKDHEFIFHVISTPLPSDSFVKVSESLYVASPEMCFLYAASMYSLPELVRLGNDLCGMYITDPDAEYGQRKRKAVTSVQKISDYLARVSQISGKNKASMALRYVCDGSNSPMESCFAAAASLPMCHGGFGIKKPFLNYTVHLDNEAAQLLGRNECVCDFVWPEAKVIIEYDSNLTHLSPDQHAYDKKRINALQLAGYTVISVTADQLRNIHRIEDLYLLIRRLIGMRTHKDRMDKYADKRWNTIKTIFYKKADWLI